MIRIHPVALLFLPLPLHAETTSFGLVASGLRDRPPAQEAETRLAPLDALLPQVMAPRPAAPQAPITQGDVLQAELHPGWREADGRYMAALHLNLAPHWKTYWRAPGDAGIPPQFDWSGSQNLQAVTVHWPSPDVFDFQGMQTIGYLHEVVLPVEVVPEDPARPVDLRVTVELGVCNDICMPASLTLSEALPEVLPAQDGGDPLIRAALARRPMTAAEAGVTAIGCRVEPIDKGLRITARLEMPKLPGHETVVMEAAGPVWVSDSASRRSGGALTATADLLPARGSDYRLDPAALRLTVLADGHAVEITGCPVN